MTEPTKADLKAAVAKLTEENHALYDLFAAIRDGASSHEVTSWIIGYAGNIGNDDYSRGNPRLLRAYARDLRRGPGCHAEHEGYHCDLRAGHDPARHEAHDDDGALIAAWDAEPAPVITDSEPEPVEFTTSSLPGRTSARCHRPGEHSDQLAGAVVDCDVTGHHAITDSERTCDQANPDSGAHCHRGGDHGVHEDTNGETWRTDGEQDAAAEHPQGNPYPDGTPWCTPCGTHHQPAEVTA